MRQLINNIKKYRWLVWGVLCLAYVIGMFHRMSMGVIRYDLEKTFNMSALTFAAIGSIFFYIYMLMQIPVGILVDTLGVRLTATIGIVLAGVGSILFGMSPTIFTVFLSRFLVGMGVSVLFVSILKIQSNWFHEKDFATMTGLTGVLGSLGGILAQAPLVILVLLLTWRYSFVLVGIFSLVLAILCFLVVCDKPSDIGLSSIMNTESMNDSIERIRIVSVLVRVCKNPYTWPACILYAGFYGSFFTLTGTWGQSYLESVYGMNAVRAANYIMIPIIGFSAASVFTGWISDRLLNRKLPMTVLGTIHILSWFILVFVFMGRPSVAILGVLFFIMGFSAASFIPGYACGKEVNNPKYAGISIAVINSGGFVGAAIVPLIFGRILDKYAQLLDSRHLYNKAFLSCLASVAVGYTFLFLIKETNCRNIYKKIDQD